MVLEEEWYNLADRYFDKKHSQKQWLELQKSYNDDARYYHNLNHVENMLLHAKELTDTISDYDILRFAIWYHDVVYKSTSSRNELKSAELFEKNVTQFTDICPDRIEKGKSWIISTQKHEILDHNNEDNAFLLDLDLAILGTDWTTYSLYADAIRREYKIYPDFMYRKGRKKVLEHFLIRKTIYFTEQFKSIEDKARENLTKELAKL